MPIFLVHGFKWPRVGPSHSTIRPWIILNNVDDAAPDYLMQETTPAALKASFQRKFPEIMQHLPELHFVEQYDPDNPTIFQPFAFVADKVITGDLSINVREAQCQLVISPAEWEAFADLKDNLAGEDAEIGWYVVYNGDVDRAGYQTTLGEGWEEEDKVCNKVLLFSTLTS